MSSVVPLFKGRGFDDEATQILGKAYDIACRSLHRKGQPSVVQEFLAKKIIDRAGHAEPAPPRSEPALRAYTEFLSFDP